jgi:hypothetical protein
MGEMSNVHEIEVGKTEWNTINRSVKNIINIDFEGTEYQL